MFSHKNLQPANNLEMITKRYRVSPYVVKVLTEVGFSTFQEVVLTSHLRGAMEPNALHIYRKLSEKMGSYKDEFANIVFYENVITTYQNNFLNEYDAHLLENDLLAIYNLIRKNINIESNSVSSDSKEIESKELKHTTSSSTSPKKNTEIERQSLSPMHKISLITNQIKNANLSSNELGDITQAQGIIKEFKKENRSALFSKRVADIMDMIETAHFSNEEYDNLNKEVDRVDELNKLA